MLFEEYTYFGNIFPEPQYLGAKASLLPRIQKFIPKNIHSVLDGFGGSQSVSFYLKQLGHTTHTNDFLSFNHQIGLGLIENKYDILTQEDIYILLSKTDLSEYHLFQDLYVGLFFTQEDAIFLDQYRANIGKLGNIYKQSLAFATINRAMTRKITMGHFGHTRALIYANDPDRIKRNASLAIPLKDLWQKIIGSYNEAVFDNKQDNKSYNMDILSLLQDRTINPDLVYYDPPYCDSHADYQSFYHILETFVHYRKDKEFVNSIKRYEPQLYSGFDKKSQIIHSFEKLFSLSQDIPHRLISRNDRSYPSPEDIASMIKPYKDVTIEYKEYAQSKGGKGSVAGSKEVLLVCTNKPSVFISHNPL